MIRLCCVCMKYPFSQVESDTAQSMKRLVELDSIKSKMLQSQNALQVNLHVTHTLLPPPILAITLSLVLPPHSPFTLPLSLPFPSFPSLTSFLISSHSTQEADNWTTLSADVEEVFASQDIHKVENDVQQFTIILSLFCNTGFIFRLQKK